MTNAIAGSLIPLLRLMFPARGRHRWAGPLPAARRQDAPACVVPLVPVGQRGHRRMPWLPVPGGAAGQPRWFHAVEVATR